MAGKIIAILDPRSQGNRTVYARLYDTAGSQVGGNIATTETGANTGIYIGDAPGALATGKYSLVFYRQRAGNDSLYASSDFYWDAATSSEITESEHNYITTTKARFDAILAAIAALNNLSAADITTEITNYGTATTSDVTAQTTALTTEHDTTQASIAALNNLSQAQVATAVQGLGLASAADLSLGIAAILSEINDGVTLTAAERSTLAASLEAAILDDVDGTAVLAGIATAVENAIGNDGDGNATLAAFQGAVTAALNNYDPPTKAELDAAESTILAAIPSPSDATAANQSAILSAVSSLAGTAATAANQASISSAIAALTNGLTSAQATELTRVLDLLEADEDFSQNTVLKYFKGTTTKLLEKTVSGGDPITQVTFVDAP